jgi:hypothetical protein
MNNDIQIILKVFPCVLGFILPMVGGVYFGVFEIGFTIVNDVHEYRSFIFCLIWNVRIT